MGERERERERERTIHETYTESTKHGTLKCISMRNSIQYYKPTERIPISSERTYKTPHTPKKKCYRLEQYTKLLKVFPSGGIYKIHTQ